MDNVQRAKRKLLEQAVVQAALALSQFKGGGGFMLPALHTNPRLYVAFGTKEALALLTPLAGLGEDGHGNPVADSAG